MSITTVKMSLPKLPNHSFKQIQTSNLKTKIQPANMGLAAYMCHVCMLVNVRYLCIYACVCTCRCIFMWRPDSDTGFLNHTPPFWERVPHWIWNLTIWTAWPSSPRDPALPPQHWVCYCAWHLHGRWGSNSGLHVCTASTSLVPFPSLTIFNICVATLLKQHSP